MSSQTSRSRSKEGLKVKGRDGEREKESEIREDPKTRKDFDVGKEKKVDGKDLETKGSSPFFDSLLQQVVGLLAVVVSDRDGVILFKSYTISFAAQLASEREKERSITSATTGPSSSFDDYPRENGEDEEDGSRINETEDDERDDDKEKWDGGPGLSGSGQGLGGSGLGRPPSASGTLASSSSSGGASSFSSSFTLAIQQARKLNLGENKYITAFYKNRTIIHANYEPLIITLVAGPVANIGLILSRVVPDIKSKLEPVKKLVADSIERDTDDDHSHLTSSTGSGTGVDTGTTGVSGTSEQRKSQGITGNSDSVG